MNINKLLETIKDTSRDYVGINGCLYQDISREELDLIVNEIERLNNILNKEIEQLNKIKKDLDFEPWSIYQVDGNIIFDLLDILKGSGKE